MDWEADYVAMIKGPRCRTVYESADMAARSGKVRLRRLKITAVTQEERDNNWLAGIKTVSRFVDPDTVMVLIPIGFWCEGMR